MRNLRLSIPTEERSSLINGCPKQQEAMHFAAKFAHE